MTSSHSEGHCKKHGGIHGFCSVGIDCKTPAIAGGFACAKHGANGACAKEGCIRNARIGKKVCFIHSTDRTSCATPGCDGYARVRGLCWKHGVKKICSIDGCGTAARSRGLCKKHSDNPNLIPKQLKQPTQPKRKLTVAERTGTAPLPTSVAARTATAPKLVLPKGLSKPALGKRPLRPGVDF